MKKMIFHIPAIIFIVFYGIALSVGLSISPLAYVCTALFVISSILLSKGMFWGGLLGILPGVYFMYMSTVDTGQLMNIEMPIGIIVVVYYLICCCYVFYKKK